jgi:hypothetical protein
VSVAWRVRHNNAKTFSASSNRRRPGIDCGSELLRTNLDLKDFRSNSGHTENHATRGTDQPPSARLRAVIYGDVTPFLHTCSSRTHAKACAVSMFSYCDAEDGNGRDPFHNAQNSQARLAERSVHLQSVCPSVPRNFQTTCSERLPYRKERKSCPTV